MFRYFTKAGKFGVRYTENDDDKAKNYLEDGFTETDRYGVPLKDMKSNKKGEKLDVKGNGSKEK